jgi:hypothetical protein
VDELWKLEYCNDQDMSKTKPTRQMIKEIPFIKNNPRVAQSESAQQTDTRTDKQKRIDDLKKQLLAPAPLRKPKVQKVEVEEEDPMSNKYKRVMDWGTPRIVVKGRQLNMDT